TSSARASSVGGTSRPSIRAVWALITSSNLLDCTTGRSAGLAPLRIPPAENSSCRKASTKAAPQLLNPPHSTKIAVGKCPGDRLGDAQKTRLENVAGIA